MTSLELITTEDLMAELKRRFPVMVFGARTAFSTTMTLDVGAYNGSPEQVNFTLDLMKRDVIDSYLQFADDLQELP